MLQSPGPVNMEVARRTAEAMANVDTETGEPRVEPPIDPTAARAFDDVVRGRAADGQRGDRHLGRADRARPQRRPLDLVEPRR